MSFPRLELVDDSWWVVGYGFGDDTDWPQQAAEARAMLDRLIETAQRNNEIADTVTTNDIALSAIRFSRPLAIGLDTIEERAIAHRQLDHYLDGLATTS